jgi:hypothetical protein
MSVRVRIAPSPTGAMHIGLVRTGLFNYLFARHHGGALVLRIEDTDQERSTPESTATILDGMRWLGLDWDEGPFFQTQRTTLYRAQAIGCSSMAAPIAAGARPRSSKHAGPRRSPLVGASDTTARAGIAARRPRIAPSTSSASRHRWTARRSSTTW